MVLMSKEWVVQSLLVHRDEEDRKPFNGDTCYHVSPVSIFEKPLRHNYRCLTVPMTGAKIRMGAVRSICAQEANTLATRLS